MVLSFVVISLKQAQHRQRIRWRKNLVQCRVNASVDHLLVPDFMRGRYFGSRDMAMGLIALLVVLLAG